MKKMRIRIGQIGKTESRIEGGQGDDCLAFTRAIEQAPRRRRTARDVPVIP